MAIKAIDVNGNKWKEFRKKCFNEDTTIKDEIDRMITKYLEG